MSGLSETERMYAADLIREDLAEVTDLGYGARNRVAWHLVDALAPLIREAEARGATAVVERVESLAAEWEEWSRTRSTVRIDAFHDAAESLRAALATPEEQP